MNNQQRRVFMTLSQGQQARLEAMRQAKIREILNGRTANDPTDFDALRKRRAEKIQKRA